MALANRDARPRSSAPPAPRVRRRSWRWPAVLGAAIILLTLPPLAIAALRSPAGSVFSGYVVIARDAYVYQALWRAGWHGAWLFQSGYTSEAMPGTLLYPWYLWSGHLLGGLSGPWLYHAARLAAGGALLFTLNLLIAELFRARVLRRWAFILAVLGGGVGTLLPAVFQLGPIATRATEMAAPGTSVADLVSMAPHLPLAMALLCWVLTVALRLRRATGIALVGSGVLATLGLQLIYPQLALLGAVVIAGWALLARRPRAVWYVVAVWLVQLPYLAYLLWVARESPLTLRVIRSSLEVGDPFGFLVLSHLVASALIVLAIAGRRLRGDLWLPALWIVGMTLFMFAPGISGVLGRSFMASSIPFGLCATPGLLLLAGRVRRRPWRRRLLTGALAASSLFGIYSLAQPFWIAGFRLDPLAEYVRRDQATLLARLEPQLTSRDLVLTTYVDGIAVPALTSARVYAGHPDMTIDAAHKSAEALGFFESWPADRRDAFLRANGIDYVLTTEPRLTARIAADPALQLTDLEGNAAVFRVRP